MSKIKGLLITLIFVFIGLPIMGSFLDWIYPGTGIGEIFRWFPSMFWMLFKEFELEDTLKSVAIYLLIAGGLVGLGATISRKTENKIWLIVSLIMTVIAIVTGSIL